MVETPHSHAHRDERAANATLGKPTLTGLKFPGEAARHDLEPLRCFNRKSGENEKKVPTQQQWQCRETSQKRFAHFAQMLRLCFQGVASSHPTS
jgi:hypothetical protein